MRKVTIVLAVLAVTFGTLTVTSTNTAFKYLSTKSMPVEKGDGDRMCTLSKVIRLDGVFNPIVLIGDEEIRLASTFPWRQSVGDLIEINFRTDNHKDCKLSGIMTLFTNSLYYGLATIVLLFALACTFASQFLRKLKQ